MYFSKDQELGAIRFWNYNKSTLESVKGIKEVEMLLNNENIWNGMIHRGEGNDNSDYSTVVQIDKWTKVPPVILKPKISEMIAKQEPIEEVDEPVEDQTRNSVKIEKKDFLSRLKDSQDESDNLKDQNLDLKPEDSSSSLPIWFQGKRNKEIGSESSTNIGESATK